MFISKKNQFPCQNNVLHGHGKHGSQSSSTLNERIHLKFYIKTVNIANNSLIEKLQPKNNKVCGQF